ncbi:hypothetical protein ABKN59_005027 [Abortiporus biennis]
MIPRTLETLPVEILYEVFIHSESPSLPHTTRHLYSVFKHAPSSIQAEYIINRYISAMTPTRKGIGIISKALQYPICNSPSIIEAILRDKRVDKKILRDDKKTELPRRFFRNLSPRVQRSSRKLAVEEEYPLPFLRYLYAHPKIPPINTNSFEGYALTKAVASDYISLVKFLLDQGASPQWKNGLAVNVAITRKDLPLVRLLIEPDMTIAEEDTRKSETKGRRKTAKRRKLEDRMKVTQEMLKAAVRSDARDIVEYLMKEKGCVPDMETVLMMSSTGS